MDRRAVEEWWQAFRHACGVDATQYGTFAFGDSAEMAEELAGLVVHGHKRATAGVAFSDELLTVFERFELVWPRADVKS